MLCTGRSIICGVLFLFLFIIPRMIGHWAEGSKKTGLSKAKFYLSLMIWGSYTLRRDNMLSVSLSCSCRPTQPGLLTFSVWPNFPLGWHLPLALGSRQFFVSYLLPPVNCCPFTEAMGWHLIQISYLAPSSVAGIWQQLVNICWILCAIISSSLYLSDT